MAVVVVVVRETMTEVVIEAEEGPRRRGAWGEREQRRLAPLPWLPWLPWLP